MKTDSLIRLLALAVIMVLLLNLTSCIKHGAQKKPYPVGTTPLYFWNITVDYAPPLTVDSYRFDDFNYYNGSNHFFYNVHDANGKSFTSVIDYDLRRTK